MQEEKDINPCGVTLLRCVHVCLAFQLTHNMASFIIYEVVVRRLTSKLSRLTEDLGFLIVSSSFFSRASILLSAPSDMLAATEIGVLMKKDLRYTRLHQL